MAIGWHWALLIFNFPLHLSEVLRPFIIIFHQIAYSCYQLSAMANSHHHHHGTANSCYQLSATAYTVPFKSIVNCSHPLGNETTWYRPDALLKIMLLSRLFKIVLDSC
ncbi:hypothetical protein DERF_002700 [Dermatophagoides farinae]|uniref:Secreted protein n=1 Tax=Dermatophagoides farinae TaxID=6954 RepID=A0A922IE87_DERFA|nr:hypothetical protein DERF_002700 [Dermatophagoides farinae]